MLYLITACLSIPCRAAGSMGKSKADEMNIWTQKEYERFSNAISKSSMKLAFDILFYTGMRSGELLALTPADILSSKRIVSIRTMQKLKVRSYSWSLRHQRQKDVFPFRISYMMIFKNTFPSYMVSEMATGYFNFQKTALEKEMKRVSGKNWSEADQST